jgi:transposase
MLKVDTSRWQHRPESLRVQALQATHARTRERLLALYEVCQGKSATAVGRQSGRNPQTIMAWVHRYNEAGFESLVYHRTGGHPPLCLLSSSKG